MGLIQGMKIKAVCDSLRMDKDTTDVMVQIHALTKGGKLGKEYFDSPQGKSLDSILSLMGKMGATGELKDQVDGVKRMFDDKEYRNRMYSVYERDVLPRLAKYRFWDIF